eukprot:6313285-Alexandrium_andersonii.AAC.1
MSFGPPCSGCFTSIIRGMSEVQSGQVSGPGPASARRAQLAQDLMIGPVSRDGPPALATNDAHFESTASA